MLMPRLKTRSFPPGAWAVCWSVLWVASASSTLMAETVAIKGGTVHTLGPAGTLEGATVLVEDGRIAAVGVGLAIPDKARVVEAAGQVVTPGLLDSYSALGLLEIRRVESTLDWGTDHARLTASFDVTDAINPRSTLIPVSRAGGLTRAVVVPRANSNLMDGRGAAIHLGGPVDYVLKAPVALFATMGEQGAARAGGSRAAAMLLLREALEDARDYSAHREAFLSGRRRAYAVSRLDLEALQPVVKGELPLAVTVHRASDIEAVLRLAAESSLRLVVMGGAEAWLVAPALARAKVPVVIDPLDNLPGSFETLGATLENAARLHLAGVTVVFGSGETHRGHNLRQMAGNAVAYGMPWEEALKAMTVNPARVWGLDDYGTLEAGREADVVVWDGDPLEVTTLAKRVFIRGVEMPTTNRQRALRERYRDLGRPWPPAYAHPGGAEP